MKNGEEISTSIMLDVEQRTIEMMLRKKKDFTQKDIEENISKIFSYLDRDEIERVVSKALSDLLQIGSINISYIEINPKRTTYYKKAKK